MADTQRLEPIVIDSGTFLQKHHVLPALPQAVHEIRTIIHSEKISIRKIVEIIKKDPGLVAQILKIVNSAYYSIPREVKDVSLAVAYLGINEVYHLVVSVYVLDALANGNKHEFNRIWYHSNYTALNSKHIAKQYEPLLNSNDIWVHSILHDIGRLVYIKFFPDHYKALRKYVVTNGCLFREAERYYDLPHSSYLGSLLCDHWGLPQDIKETCAAHDLEDLKTMRPETEPERIRRIVTIGSLLTSLATEKLRHDISSDISEAVQKSLGCTESEFLVTMARVYELKIDMEKYFRS